MTLCISKPNCIHLWDMLFEHTKGYQLHKNKYNLISFLKLKIDLLSVEIKLTRYDIVCLGKILL